MNNALLNGTYNHNAIKTPPNGSVPYHYGDSDSERARAISDIIRNPYPITTEGIERGKELYIINCGICHGEKGNADGYLVRDGSPYPAAPANFLTAAFRDTSNGAFYHSIMYGKNVMGGYADKLSYEERWQVIHYIRSAQANEFKLEYSQTANTLNGDMPGANYVSSDHFMSPKKVLPEIFTMSHGGHEGAAHGDGHDDHGESHDDGHDDHDHGDGGDHDHDDDHNHDNH